MASHIEFPCFPLAYNYIFLRIINQNYHFVKRTAILIQAFRIRQVQVVEAILIHLVLNI